MTDEALGNAEAAPSNRYRVWGVALVAGAARSGRNIAYGQPVPPPKSKQSSGMLPLTSLPASRITVP